LIQKTKGSGQETWYYSYDHRKRLTGIRQTSDGTSNLLLLTYTYDVENNRVQELRWTQATGTTTQRYAYDGGDVIADLDGSSNIQTRRLYGPGTDMPLVRISGGNVVAYLPDRLGSIRDLMDWAGNVQANIRYDAYGIRTDSNASFADRYGYTGREWQSNAQLQYNRARWYDPRIGRWISEDPIAFAAGDGNLYRYVGNEATNATDPDGLQVRPAPPRPSSGGRPPGSQWWNKPEDPTNPGWIHNRFVNPRQYNLEQDRLRKDASEIIRRNAIESWHNKQLHEAVKQALEARVPRAVLENILYQHRIETSGTAIATQRIRDVDAAARIVKGADRWLPGWRNDIDGVRSLYGLDQAILGFAKKRKSAEEKIQDQIKRAGLPQSGNRPFIASTKKNSRGEEEIEKAEVQHGPKRGKRGYVDREGRIWIKDYAHAGYPDHWDVQIDGGRDYIKVGLDGNELTKPVNGNEGTQ
jgi:RHS repeat-associated protein